MIQIIDKIKIPQHICIKFFGHLQASSFNNLGLIRSYFSFFLNPFLDFIRVFFNDLDYANRFYSYHILILQI